MTNEEFERTKDFILEQQARFSADISRLGESDPETRWLLAEQSALFAEQSALLAEQSARADERLTRLERQSEFQQGLLTAVIETQDRASQDVRMLTAQVDRIADAVALLLDRANRARNDGANGKA